MRKNDRNAFWDQEDEMMLRNDRHSTINSHLYLMTEEEGFEDMVDKLSFHESLTELLCGRRVA
ncbi:MAG: hypothetical protein KBB32_01500 [Spirochaetia bacterium]|nr:hypothetical protein [Spirochaetia bacterium]